MHLIQLIDQNVCQKNEEIFKSFGNQDDQLKKLKITVKDANTKTKKINDETRTRTGYNQPSNKKFRKNNKEKKS